MIFDKLLRTIDGRHVLDVGCGEGQFTEILIGSLRSFDSVTGVDMDERSLEEARKKFPGERFRFLKIDPDRLPFNDESFDLAVISKTLHHVEDPEITLKEMKRVLRKGGYLLINEMHRDQLTDAQASHMIYHHLRSEIDNILGVSHNQTFHRADLIGLGERLGLKEKVIAEFSPDASKARDPANIKEFSRKMDQCLPWLDGHPKKPEIAEKVEDLKKRFRKYGISRPPQMVIFGIK